MRAFRADGDGRKLGLAALLIACLAAGPAVAQLGPPVPLIPQQRPEKPVPGATILPGPTAAQPQEIETQPLAPTDASWTGVLGQDKGAFPPMMWRGTSRSFVVAALTLLHPSSSPVLQDLARRLLLSNAVAPAGQDKPDRPSLVTARLERVVALGEVHDGIALTDALPDDRSGEGLDRMRVELRFAANDAKAACQTVDDRMARYQNPWWDRALIACQALAGDGAKASLGMSLLREQKAPPDASFDALIDSLGGRARKVEKLPDPSPMRLALLAAAKQPLPPDVLANAGPAALLAYATNETAPLERRLPAAERAALLGALAPDALATLYRQVQAKPEEQTEALKDAKPPADAKARAVLYGIVRSSAPAQTRQAAIAAFLADAKRRGAFPLAAQLVVPALDELKPADAPQDFASEAARVFLVMGDVDAAGPWIDASGNTALQLLERIARGAGRDPRGRASLLQDGVAALAGRDAAAAPAQVDVLVAIAGEFDTSVAAIDLSAMMTPPHDTKMPGAALWLDLQGAMTAKRLGETVLTSILLVGAEERLSLEPVLLGRAIAGLRAVGLEAEARALAIEAAIDVGI